MCISASLSSLVWSNFKNTKHGLLQGYPGTVVQGWTLRTESQCLFMSRIFFRCVSSSWAEGKLQTFQSCITGFHAFNVFLQFPVQTELWLYIIIKLALHSQKLSAVAYKLTQYCVDVGMCLQGLDLKELAGFLSTSFSLVMLNAMKFVQDLSGMA